MAEYAIGAIIKDPTGSALPSLSVATSGYLPSSLTSLSTALTSSGTLPRGQAGDTSVAQRRAHAPPIVATSSPASRPTKQDVAAYLSQVGHEYDRFVRERQLGSTGTADLGESTTSSLRASNKKEELPPLDHVPTIFFDPAFNLSNPRTFDLVTERIQLSPLPATTSSATEAPALSKSASQSFDSILVAGLGPTTLADLATDQILQEKLSHYTAIVETHLVREIGARSASFFAALGNLQDLHKQGEDCLLAIASLRRALSTDSNGVGAAPKRALEMLRMQARRRALERIEGAVRAVEEVHQAAQGVAELVEQGEWITALDVSDSILDAYSSRSSSSTSKAGGKLDLSKLRSLDYIPSLLRSLRVQIARSLEGELLGVLAHEAEQAAAEYKRITRGEEGGKKWKGKARLSVSTSSLSASARGPLSPTALTTTSGDLLSPLSTAAVAGNITSGVYAPQDAAEHEPGAEDAVLDRLRDRARPAVSGLVRAEGMEEAVAAWRETVLRDVRALVREHLPSSDEPGTPPVEDEATVRGHARRISLDHLSVSEKSVTLAKNLKALSHAEFVSLTRETFVGLLGCVEVVDGQAKVLSELVVEARDRDRRRKANGHNGELSDDDDEPPVSPGLSVPGEDGDHRPKLSVSTASIASSMSGRSDEDGSSSAAILSALSSVVHASAELANLRFSKVIGVRSEVHATLSLPEFLEIFDAAWGFLIACEVVCRRMIVGLRGVMVSQAKAWLQAFHQQRISKSARLVEEEQWAASEVEEEQQQAVQFIVQASTEDPLELILDPAKNAAARRVRELRDTAAENGQNGQEEDKDMSSSTKKAKQLEIEGRKYFPVSAGLQSIELLLDYVKVVVNCPLLATDLMGKVVEYMKAFNSRTCQVVLGAGAMRSAGLKNITAKHLALASQALSIMIALIPYIRETLRRHLSSKQAVLLTEFDKLRRDFQEHQNEVHAKLVAIMSDRLAVHCRTLQSIDWEDRKDGVNSYMEALVKEHTTLHKVLSRFLANDTLDLIMGQVMSSLNSRLADEYSRITLKSENGKERMLVDVGYLKNKLAELKGLSRDTPGVELEKLVFTKTLPPPPRGSIQLSRNGSTSSLVASASRTSLQLNGAEAEAVSPKPPAKDVPAPLEPVLSPPPPPPAAAAPVEPVTEPVAEAEVEAEPEPSEPAVAATGAEVEEDEPAPEAPAKDVKDDSEAAGVVADEEPVVEDAREPAPETKAPEVIQEQAAMVVVQDEEVQDEEAQAEEELSALPEDEVPLQASVLPPREPSPPPGDEYLPAYLRKARTAAPAVLPGTPSPPPVLPSTPVSAPKQQVTPVSAPPQQATPPPQPVQKVAAAPRKSMAERLAELAGRGSMSLPTVSSPPSAEPPVPRPHVPLAATVVPPPPRATPPPPRRASPAHATPPPATPPPAPASPATPPPIPGMPITPPPQGGAPPPRRSLQERMRELARRGSQTSVPPPVAATAPIVATGEPTSTYDPVSTTTAEPLHPLAKEVTPEVEPEAEKEVTTEPEEEEQAQVEAPVEAAEVEEDMATTPTISQMTPRPPPIDTSESDEDDAEDAQEEPVAAPGEPELPPVEAEEPVVEPAVEVNAQPEEEEAVVAEAEPELQDVEETPVVPVAAAPAPPAEPEVELPPGWEYLPPHIQAQMLAEARAKIQPAPAVQVEEDEQDTPTEEAGAPQILLDSRPLSDSMVEEDGDPSVVSPPPSEMSAAEDFLDAESGGEEDESFTPDSVDGTDEEPDYALAPTSSSTDPQYAETWSSPQEAPLSPIFEGEEDFSAGEDSDRNKLSASLTSSADGDGDASFETTRRSFDDDFEEEDDGRGFDLA